jgi:hypothetical protein
MRQDIRIGGVLVRGYIDLLDTSGQVIAGLGVTVGPGGYWVKVTLVLIVIFRRRWRK